MDRLAVICSDMNSLIEEINPIFKLSLVHSFARALSIHNGAYLVDMIDIRNVATAFFLWIDFSCKELGIVD